MIDIKQLFVYRPEGKVISIGEKEEKIMVIRRGPRGIVSVIQSKGPIVIWDKEEAEAHIEDSEEDLIKKTIDVLSK